MTTLGNINQPTGLVTLTTGQVDFPTNIIFFNPPTPSTLAQVTTAGYLNQYASKLNIQQMGVVFTTDEGTVLLQVTNSGSNWQFAVPTDTVAGVTYTGTLTPGNLVSINGAGGVIQDAGLAASALQLKANLKGAITATYGGGGTSNTFAATGLTAASIVTAVIVTSTNAVSIAKAVPGTNTLAVTFSADPGAGTTVAWIALAAAQ